MLYKEKEEVVKEEETSIDRGRVEQRKGSDKE